MIGRTVGNYRIVDKLGDGGMGSVYRAVDQMVQRNVAIKALRPDLASNPEVSGRLHSEAVALAKLNHPAIATLYSFFREGDEYFIALEYVPGRNLEQILRASGALAWQHAAGILLHALAGMSHAHAQGIIHRDLKPANIMITPEGGVKLTDFGIARMFYAPRLTRDARVVGTPEYLAPERILAKEADARSDIYSLGIVFYEMLTGRLPFESTSDFELMRAQLESRPRTLAEVGVSVPAPIEQCLMTAIEKDPAKRYQDAGQFARQLREAIAASGCAVAELAGVFDVGAKETLFQRPPRETTSAAAPKETVFTAAPKETVFTAPPKETVFPPLPKETAVTPAIRGTAFGPSAKVPAAPVPVPVVTTPQRDRSKLLLAWIAAASLLAIVLGFVVAVLFRSSPHSSAPPPPISIPDSPKPAVASNPASNPPVIPTPAPSPETQPQPPITPPKPSPETGKAPERETTQRLSDVKTLYIRPVLDEFDSALREEIEHELSGRLEIAKSAGKADAVLSVVINDSHGNRISGAARQVVGMKGSKKAIATITDSSGQHQLWTAEVDDRHNFVTALRDDMKRLASRLAKRLRSDLR